MLLFLIIRMVVVNVLCKFGIKVILFVSYFNFIKKIPKTKQASSLTHQPLFTGLER